MGLVAVLLVMAVMLWSLSNDGVMVDADDESGECSLYSESLLPPPVIYTAASLVLLSVSVTVAW